MEEGFRQRPEWGDGCVKSVPRQGEMMQTHNSQRRVGCLGYKSGKALSLRVEGREKGRERSDKCL